MAMLSDTSVVRVWLPLVSAVQLGGWFYEHMIRRYSIAPSSAEITPSDEDRLRFALEELPKSQPLAELQRAPLLEKLKLKHPKQFQIWQQDQAESSRRQQEFNLRHRREIFRNRIIALSILLAVAYGIIRFVRWLL